MRKKKKKTEEEEEAEEEEEEEEEEEDGEEEKDTDADERRCRTFATAFQTSRCRSLDEQKRVFKSVTRLYLARLLKVMPSTSSTMASRLRRSTRFTARDVISTSSSRRVTCHR